jgi:TPR repeat protein
MSVFTDAEHAYIVHETEKWQNATIEKLADYYRIGLFHYRLKDYYKACCYLKKAAEQAFVPALYSLGVCMSREEGCSRDERKEADLFRQAYDYYSGVYALKDYSIEDEATCSYRLGMCYSYNYGTEGDNRLARKLFESTADRFGASAFELGYSYEKGRLGLIADDKKAMDYYRKAYDLQYEDAIFSHFTLFHGEFEKYPYQREIKEAYSFRIGQLMRLSVVSPCRDSYNRLAQLYENGYPGDRGENDKRFKKKAEMFRKKAELLNNEYNFGKFLVFPDSVIYQSYIDLSSHV